MAELIIEPEAEAELEEAGDRYEESVPGLGLDFLLEMRERFPHLIVYLPFGDAVHVLAFMHPRRRPGYWANRGPLRQ